MIRLCLLLMFPFGRGTDEQDFPTKTVHVGEAVTLTCSRPSESGILFWIKLAPGHLPEVLAASYTFGGSVNTTPRVTAKHEPGTFVLRIDSTELSDTAFYYCETLDELKKHILNTTFLRVKGPEPDITAVIQHFSSDPVRPGDSVTLQCSFVSEPDGMCPDHSVYWFRAASDAAQPVSIYVNAHSDGECETSSEAQSSRKCTYSFSRHNISSSDAGTYYCAVATCGQILFGKGVNLDIDEVNVWFYVLSAALSVIIIAVLIYIIKRNAYDCFSGSDPVQRNAPTNSDQQRQNVNEDALVYSVTNFVKRKPAKKERTGANEAEGELIYSDVRVLE